MNKVRNSIINFAGGCNFVGSSEGPFFFNDGRLIKDFLCEHNFVFFMQFKMNLKVIYFI